MEILATILILNFIGICIFAISKFFSEIIKDKEWLVLYVTLSAIGLVVVAIFLN